MTDIDDLKARLAAATHPDGYVDYTDRDLSRIAVRSLPDLIRSAEALERFLEVEQYIPEHPNMVSNEDRKRAFSSARLALASLHIGDGKAAPSASTDVGRPDDRLKAAEVLISELAGALAGCVEQMSQMRKMFDDADGTIQAAFNDAEHAEARLGAYRNGNKQKIAP